MTAQKSKSVVGIFILVFILFMIFMVFAFYTVASLKSTGDESDSIIFNKGKGPIAVVTIEGVIMESRKIIERLHTAEKDKSVKAIIVRVDSPGGAVGPTQEVYEEIVRIDQEKPVYASFGSIAASGGYYIGAATRKIYSNAGTLTGSIGVIMHFMDMSKLYDWAKLRPQTVKAGKYKDIGSPFRGMTNDEKKLMDGMIIGVHKQFINDILKRRKDKIKGKLINHAQGQIFSGEDAYNLGLVDELAGLWAAARKIHKDLGIEQDFGLRFIKKRKKMNFMDIIQDVDESVTDIKNYFKSTARPLLIYTP
jgi:protease-4